MRVLVAGYYTRPVGGVESYIRELLPRLLGTGAQVGLLTLAAGDPCTGGIADFDIPWVNGYGLTAAAVAERTAGWRPDVVYAHGLGDPELEELIVARVPTVYFAHNYGGTCVSGNKALGSPCTKPCARPMGLGCLAVYLPRRCGGMNPVTAIRLYRQEQRRLRAIGQCRSVTVASYHMAAEMARNGIRADRVHVTPLFPTGITPDTSPPIPKPRSDRILFVGRLTSLKGWRQLLAAMPVASAELGRRLTLVVAGDGPDRAAFEAEAIRRQVPTEFLGWVGPERREAEMRTADVLAVPSVWPEPFGLVGIEAGCVGLTAVAFAVGGIPDWLTPGVSGELAPGERPDSSELASALVRALASDDYWQQLRVGAWETARRFTPEAHLERLFPILEAAANK